MEQELRNLLNSARIEILQLRKSNEVLGSKVEVLNLFSAIFLGQQNRGESIDVAWQLERYLTVHQKEETENGTH